MTRAGMMLVLLLCLSPPAAASSPVVPASLPDTVMAPRAGSACALPITVADSTLLGVEVDGHWHRFGQGVVACRIKGDETQWIVDYIWVLVPQLPGVPLTMAGMDSLMEGGVITGETNVQLATYRTRMTGRNVEEIRNAAFTRKPESAPPLLVQEILRQTAQADSIETAPDH